MQLASPSETGAPSTSTPSTVEESTNTNLTESENIERLPVQGLPTAQLSARESGANGAARRLTASGDAVIQLHMQEDCWIEIKNLQGRVLFGDLGRAGQTLEFVGAGPFRILLGYAQGVTVLYNGESVPLAPHTRANVATFVIGQ